MKLSELICFPKFILLDKLSDAAGICTQLGERDSFYIGEGIIIGITRRQFRVENNCRIEYGDSGKYCLSVNAFTTKEYAKIYYKMQEEEDDCGISGVSENVDFLHGLKYGDKFSDVQNSLAIQKKGNTFHQEGENRGMNQLGKFVYQYDYIKFDNVIYYFFGKSKKGTLQGVSYYLI